MNAIYGVRTDRKHYGVSVNAEIQGKYCVQT